MIDPKIIKENPNLVIENNKKRGIEIDLAMVQDLISKRANAITYAENLRAQANEVASQIPKTPEADRKTLIEKGKELKEQVKKAEEGAEQQEADLNRELRKFPNILREDVAMGEEESSNIVIRQEGKLPRFTFEPKDHLELGEALGIIDMQRAAKVSGARFVYLKGEAVLIEFALVQYMLSILTAEGFVPVLPPHIISTQAMQAMGYLDHGGEDEVYHLKNDDQVLIGTSEQAIGPMLMDEIIEAKDLPLRFVAYSPCYRREAGSYGKDVKGILRLHQFNKMEMFSFTTPEDSDTEHEFLLSMQERLMQGLKLPYQIVKLCSGDTGAPSARTYDIETWIPSQDKYRETHSTSNTTDFQTRRLKARFKLDGKTELLHALNGTAFADRIIIAILENYQQADGSVIIPDILRPFIGKDKIEPKN
ncbi:MAG: serine--tRNA ligase [Patescibacteria group bacterium]